MLAFWFTRRYLLSCPAARYATYCMHKTICIMVNAKLLMSAQNLHEIDLYCFYQVEDSTGWAWQFLPYSNILFRQVQWVTQTYASEIMARLKQTAPLWCIFISAFTLWEACITTVLAFVPGMGPTVTSARCCSTGRTIPGSASYSLASALALIDKWRIHGYNFRHGFRGEGSVRSVYTACVCGSTVVC